jgi:hypothetical protein
MRREGKTMTKLKRIGTAFAACALAALLAGACSNPFSDKDNDRQAAPGKGSITLRFSAAAGASPSSGIARTIMPNPTDLYGTVNVTLTGPGPTMTSSGAPNSSFEFPNIAVGTWQVSATLNSQSGAQVGTGSASLQVAGGASLSESIALRPSPGANGSLRLNLMWPYSDEGNIVGLLARIATVDGATVASNSPIVVTQPGAYNSAIVQFESLPPGAYLLTLVFQRGNYDAGTFVEAVNIYPGQVSNRWINGSGNAYSTRSFNASDFLDASASLGNMAIGNMAGHFLFSPAQTEYLDLMINNQAFSFTPTQGGAGQSLRYRWTTGAGAEIGGEIASGQTMTGLSYALGTNILVLTVTAPDRATPKSYIFTVNAYQLTYSLNDATTGTEPAPTIAPYCCQITLPSVAGIWRNGTACLGWCTTPSGRDGGMVFSPGDIFTLTSNATLFALWLSESVRNIDTSAGTWTPTGPLSPEDLLAISQLIGSAGHGVNLDLSGAVVAEIPNNLFLNSTNLVGITFPPSLASIGSGAFRGCSGLMDITIPNSVTNLGDSAFLNCGGLKHAVIGNGVASIGASAFQGCDELDSVSIPNGVTSIGEQAFRNCSGLSAVAIPASVTSIGAAAFMNCATLMTIDIGIGLQSLGTDAFDGCTAVNSTLILRCGSVLPYDSFTNISPASIYVPQAFYVAYQTTSGWSLFSGGSVFQQLP